MEGSESQGLQSACKERERRFRGLRESACRAPKLPEIQACRVQEVAGDRGLRGIEADCLEGRLVSCSDGRPVRCSDGRPR